MRTIVFDVNETLLDLTALAPEFERVFGAADTAKTWFAQLLQNALVATVTTTYRDFGVLAGAALGTVAQQRGVSLASADRDSILQKMRNLPPHDDVRPSLERLRAAGFRLATLTNSPDKVLQEQLEHAGLSDLFDATLSVDEVGLFKPHKKVYEMAADKLGVNLMDIRMVAAHAWDTTGAIRAGCKAAFVARPGKVLGACDELPDIVANTLFAVVEQIVEQDG
ncbi:haloacid dehalogenase type II [soil metagenome]